MDQYEKVALQICHDMQFPDANYITHPEPENIVHIHAHPEWKDNPYFLMSHDNLPDINELYDINHPHFVILLLNSFKESVDIEKRN
jgi:hypothetical protein